MATAKKLTDNHLTCAICTEVFTDPATLQCNHTFCKSCLLKYTKTQTEAIKAKSIQCPSCRQQTKVTNPDSPVEEWVGHLKPSHVIQSLMDDFGGSSDVDACSVCKEDGQTTPGTMWCTICEDVFCDGCLKLHKKMPISRDHEVLDVRIHGNRKAKVRNFMCRIHKDEKIKLFCKDCRMTMCTVCCSIKHRKCDGVETIDVMMPLVKETLVSETRNQEKKIQTYTDNISSTNSNIEKLTTSAQEMKDEVRKVRMEAADVLVRKEKELLDRIDKLTESRVKELKAYRKNQEDDIQVEQQRFEFTNNVLTSDCVADMFDMYESVGGASRDEDASENKRPQTSIIFEHAREKLMKSLDEVQLGEVKVAGGRSPVLLESIDLSSDRKGLIENVLDFCAGYRYLDFRDVVIFALNDIRVITVIDYFYRLISYYVQNTTSLKKHLQLPSGPVGITKVGGTKAAVTLPYTQQIAFIELDPEPTLQSTVKTKRKYRGLAFLNPAQLVAGTLDGPASVDVLDMAGNVLKSINTGVISTPQYIHVMRNNNVVVSEAEVKSLVSVTLDGQAVFTFTPRGARTLEHPQGITTTSTGDILFADSGSHKVIQLTEFGQFVRNVLTARDGLEYPTGICLGDDGLLYVTSGGYVKVYAYE